MKEMRWSQHMEKILWCQYIFMDFTKSEHDMKKIVIALIAMSFLSFTGCGNLSPRSNNKINNQDGKLDEIRNNMNGLQLDLLKHQEKLDLIARDIGNIQQGNLNSQNSGVQIFSGGGGLIFALTLVGVAVMVIIHYYGKATENEKAAQILADEIGRYNNIDLDNSVFLAARHTNVEKKIYNLMVSGQNKANRDMLGAHQI